MSTENPGQQGAGAGAGAGSGAGAGAGSGAEHPAAPWANVEGEYKIGEGDKAVPFWNGITEEPIREFMKAKNYKNPDEVGRALWNANKLVNIQGDVQAVLDGKATDEQRNNFYRALGRPEKPEGYNFKFPDGVKTDENMIKFGQSLFHKLGANEKDAQAAVEEWQKFVTASEAATVEADRVQNEKEMKALETKYGAELEQNKAAGLRAMQALGLPPELVEKVEGKIGSAGIVELLVAIGRKSDEGGFKGGNDRSDPDNIANMSPEEAKAKITQLEGDAEFQKAYKDKTHAGHKDALAKMEKLFAKAEPKQTA